MSNPYQNALDVQDACNLSGVVHSFSEDVTKLFHESCAAGLGTEYVNRHPVVRLYLEKLCQLAGMVAGDAGDSFTVCWGKAKELRESEKSQAAGV